MATLTGSTIAGSYDQLLALPSGGGNGATLVALTDGNAGNTFALQLSTGEIKSTGTLSVAGVSTFSSDVRLEDDAGGEYVGIASPSAATTYTVTLPAAVGGSGQALRTSDGSGTLEWFTPEVGDITGVTAGTNLNGGGSSGAVTLNLDTTLTGLTSVTSTAFVGDITGDVTGDVSGSSGSCTGNAATVTNGVYTTNNLSVLSATTSAQLAGVISDETGSGSLVFASSPTLVTPALGTPASGTLTNCTFPTLNQDTTGTAATVTGATQAAITSAANLATVGTIGTGVWQGTAVDGAYVDIEGTEVKSTGEGGGTKFLREDGDGTCSWQAPSGNVSKVGTPVDSQVGVWTGDGTIEGTNDLVFDSTGLGIGTAAPSTPLHIQSAQTTGMCLIRNTAGTISNGTSVLEVRSDDTSDAGAHDLLNLNNDGTVRFLVQADGNCGIALNDPSAVLEVSGGTNTLGIIRMTQRVSSAAAYGLDMGLDPTTGDPVFSRIVNDTVSEAIRIVRSDGDVSISQNLGIGTAVPSSKLHVVGDVNVATGNITLDGDYGINNPNRLKIKTDTNNNHTDTQDVLTIYSNNGSTEVQKYAKGGQIFQPVETLTTGDTVDIDFSKSNLQTFTLDGSESQTELTGSNYAAGRTVRLMIDMTNDMHSMGITVPSNWTNCDIDPSYLSSMGIVLCELTSWTAAEGGVTARWSEQAN